MTPGEKASEHLFGRASYVPQHTDLTFPDPRQPGARVSWDELVARYSVEQPLG